MRVQLFERLLTLRNDVGLLSEEYDPHAKRRRRQFPVRAFAYLAPASTPPIIWHRLGGATKKKIRSTDIGSCWAGWGPIRLRSVTAFPG